MSLPDIKHSIEWVKFPNSTEVVFVGRDVVALGKGCHMCFFSLSLGTHKLYSATDSQMGDGVQCYTGHRTLPILAFAEKCLNPRIIFIRYSDFEKIKILSDGAPEGYQAIAFSDVEYFISLSTLPEFELIIWNWRTGDKLAVERTHVQKTNQYLSVNYNYPVNVVQHYENASKILLWEIHFGYKNAILLKNEIELPYNDSVINVLWNTEGNLYILNKSGCVYMLNQEGKLNMIIYSAIIGNARPCFTWFKGGLIIMEPNSQIKQFKKGVNGLMDWNISPVKVRQFLTTTTATGKDYLIGWTDAGEILELDLQKQRFLSKKECFSNISDFCLIYPLCNYFVSLSLNGKDLKIWDAILGKEINTITIEDKINVIASNPVYPYIATGLYNGTLILVSFYNSETPIILTKFSLYRKEINKIVFNKEGNLIAAAQMKEGIFFIIRGTPREKLEIISCINYQHTALDIAIVEHEKSYKLLILTQSENNEIAGNKIHVKMVLKSNLKVKKKNYICQRLLTNFIALNKRFIAKIYDEQNLSVFQLHKKYVKCTSEIVCKYHPYYYIFKTNGRNVFTYTVNGLLTIYNEDDSELLANFLVHHRNDAGVINALVDPYLRFVISLGKENELVCTKMIKSIFDENKYKAALDTFNEYKECLTQSTTILIDPENDITYTEQKHHERIMQEQEKFAKQRKEIFEEFLLLKNELVALFEQNLNGPELEKIDTLEFYLHIKLKEHKEKLCEKECEWIQKYYNELIRAQNELWECMKNKFWDTQLIKRSVIKGIFSNFHVENYGLIPENKKFQSKCNYFLMLREFEKMLRTGDLLLPRTTNTANEFQQAILTKPLSIEFKTDNDNENVDSTNDYPSSIVSQFLQENMFYNQGEIHTFTQSYFQKFLINQTSIQLRKLFNKTYDDILNEKKEIMKSISEMNARLRFILSELEITNVHIKDPVWNLAEDPESIITVANHELAIKPYISASCQNLLDQQAEKEERIRLILLADDFREKTLTKIMDGLLEVQWEDTLKWDISKPKCLLEKRPEKYNTEDLLAVKEYEEKVEFLNSERQRYRDILQNEYTQVSETVRETIKHFNSKLSELSLFKIKVETARLQHSLMVQLMQDACFKREDLNKTELDIRKKIKISDERIAWINNKISELIESSNECKNTAELLSIKEKTIDKNFKKEIQDFSALVQEQGYKLFKKQPKGNFQTVNSPTLLHKLGVCVVSQGKSQLLTVDCVEFLKSIDKLDEYVGVPNSIDETVYKIICKYRRMRIEVEIRIKANQLEQIDVDFSVQYFQKVLIERKDSAAQLVAELNNTRMRKIELVHDKPMQIVVKRGLVEIPTSGYISDYDAAILVDRHQIEHVNNIIRNAGQRKLMILRAIMLHRREITGKEWEHKRKRIEIEDLKEFHYMIGKVKITKEIQQYLLRKEKQRNNLFHKDLSTFDQEFESTRKTYDRILEERNKAINELEKQIQAYKKKNNVLDQKISAINVNVCEQELARDVEFEKNYKIVVEKRIKAIMKRSTLIKNIQEQHNEILVLQTELELARLRTYPTLKFKTA